MGTLKSALWLTCVLLILPLSLGAEVELVNGTYLNFDMSELVGTPPSDCPNYIRVPENATQKVGTDTYDFNLNGFSILYKNCTYTAEKETVLNLIKARAPPDSSNKSYSLLSLTIPSTTLKCSSEEPDQTNPLLQLSFVPMAFYYEQSFGAAGNMTKTQNETETQGYMILFQAPEHNMVCLFFTEAHRNKVKETFQKMMNGTSNPGGPPPGAPGENEMKIESGKSLEFCAVCGCEKELGNDLELDKVKFVEDDAEGIKTTEMEKEVHWRPPKLYFGPRTCPIHFSKRYEEVISQSESPEMSEDLSEKTIRELAKQAVVDKLYEEMVGELSMKERKEEFGMRTKEILVMAESFPRRKVLALRKGEKCGRNGRQLEKDTVLLYERKHILSQLENNPFILKHESKVKSIRQEERENEHAFTLHVLRKGENGLLSVCAMANSKRACDLLSSKEFCDNFKPFGSTIARSRKDLEGGKGENVNGPPTGTMPPPNGTGMPGTNATPLPQNGQAGEQKNPADESQLGTSNGPANSTVQPVANGTVVASPTVTPQNGQISATSTPSPTPTSAPASVSASPTASDSNSTSALCFPSEAKVELENGTVVGMEELQVGDSIRDGDGKFSTVILFTHADSQVVSEFVRIETDGADIELSPKHYIPADGKLVTADNVREGSKLLVMAKGNVAQRVVRKVGRVWKRGLYNPQTVSGTVAVTMNGNAIMASTYTAAVHPTVAHTLLAPLRFLSDVFGVVIPVWSRVLREGNDGAVNMLPSGNGKMIL